MAKRANGEGSFRKGKVNGNDYYIYDFPMMNGKRKRVYAKTKAELMAKIDDYKKRLRTPLNNSKLTVAEVTKYWITNVSEVSPRTKENYYGILDVRIARNKNFDIGNVPIKDVTETLCSKFLFSLCEDYSERSIERTWAVLEQALKYAIKEGYLKKLDFEDVKKPKEKDVVKKKKNQITLEKEDMDILYKECMRKNIDGTLHYGISAVILAVIINTGLRINEVCSLTWSDIASDFTYLEVNSVYVTVPVRDENGVLTGETETLEKDPKTKSSKRRVPLPVNASKLLKELKDERKYDDDLVFHTRNGKFVGRTSVEKCLQNIIKNTCLPDGITPHTLRHAYGSLLISEGTDIKVVSKLMGHTSVSFTYDTYINVLRSDEKKTTDVLDGIFGKEETMENKVGEMSEETKARLYHYLKGLFE